MIEFVIIKINMTCPKAIQQSYIHQIHERNTIEKAQFKEVIQDYMLILKQLQKSQEQYKTLERENYTIK